jgi:hypothetical protein
MAKIGLENQAYALVYLEALGFCFVFIAMASIAHAVHCPSHLMIICLLSLFPVLRHIGK